MESNFGCTQTSLTEEDSSEVIQSVVTDEEKATPLIILSRKLNKTTLDAPLVVTTGSLQIEGSFHVGGSLYFNGSLQVPPKEH